MKDNKYNPNEIEEYWQKEWEESGLFSPDVNEAKNPYYNLMMFPYPSAEGLHVGNMYAFTGADVFARFNRMQGKDVFEPIGLDGFGIHSENYALKVGRHPKEQAKLSEDNFYRQLRSIGNSFDWKRTVETYDPTYYRWTQWLFVQLFKAGLAYRATALVNWCPKDLTVLSDEQVIDGKCERCGSEVSKKELEQWFFRITKYADRLLGNIDGLNWSEKVKVAQRNWIGKSEGAEVDFEVDEEANYVLLHGFTGSVEANFFPWLRGALEKKGKSVWAQNLPNTDNPSIDEQAGFVLKNAHFDENTVLLGHSLGSTVALRVLEKLQKPIKKLVLAAGFMEPGFLDHERSFEEQITKFDVETIKKNVGEIVLLRAQNDTAVPQERSEYIKGQIGGKIVDFTAKDDHICGEIEPVVLENLITRIKIFTTRPDTLFGATFLVLSPEHEIVRKIEDGSLKIEETIRKEVRDYIKLSRSMSDIERTADGKEKTGVITGLLAVNPVNSKKIAILVADYVLSGYGTGAIMAVPAHDQRDFETAKKFNMPIVPVIQSKEEITESATMEKAFEGEGIIIGSDSWNGFHVPSDIPKVIDWLEKEDIGVKKSNFHLRDWLISRQRYWGPPIPMIFCGKCFDAKKGERSEMSGWYSVPESDLPVLLPDVSDWKPEGSRSVSSGQAKGPLANHPEFYKTKCPGCGGDAKRETDVSDTFLDSSWYYLRYPSTDIETAPFDIARTSKWLPVNMYIGGAEHAVLHLLYSRFVAMVLHDLNFLSFEEPFSTFFAHGLIIKDGAKMSKSKGNVVIPDEYIKKYGADSLRTYLMFLGPYEDGGDFRDSGIEGMYKFLRKVWKLMSGVILSDVRRHEMDSPLGGKDQSHQDSSPKAFDPINRGQNDSERLRMMHKTIQKVTKDIKEFGYNTAIASLMEWYNFLNSGVRGQGLGVNKEEVEVFLKLFAPFAPHMIEELWQQLIVTASETKQSEIATSRNSGTRNDIKESIHLSPWPAFDEKYLSSETVTIVVQVNGKRRGEIQVQSSKFKVQSEVEEMAREAVAKYLEGKEVKKTIYVPEKIVNFVI